MFVVRATDGKPHISIKFIEDKSVVFATVCKTFEPHENRTFACERRSRYVKVEMMYEMPLQVCEVEVFASGMCCAFLCFPV
jgi:hypothetical protein